MWSVCSELALSLTTAALSAHLYRENKKEAREGNFLQTLHMSI